MPTFGKHFHKEMEAAGISGEGVSVPLGEGELTFGPEVEPERKAAILALASTHNPILPLFSGHPVRTAADVDRVTSQRILDYLAPHWAGEPGMQERHLLRALQDFARAQEIKRDPASWTADEIAWADQAIAEAKTKDAQVLAYRQEAAAFKTSQGW